MHFVGVDVGTGSARAGVFDRAGRLLGTARGDIALHHGPGGMVEWLAKLPQRTRRCLIHINNSNPILDTASDERAALTRAGIEVCEDGMSIRL